ncbi:PAS domain S-box protein [bacterium]|nr:MAG: PAS domain S-box protein [bacterium]
METGLYAPDLLHTISDGFVVLDSEFRYLYANPAALKLVGREQLAGLTLWEEFPSVEGTPLGEFIRARMADRMAGETVYYNPARKGWSYLRGSPCPQGLVIQFVDVTEVKERERRALRAEAIQSALVENAGLAIVATDEHGLITTFNRAAETMLGYQDSELVGKASPLRFFQTESLHPRIHGQSEAGATTAMEALLNDTDLFRAEWSLSRKDGRPVPVAVTLTRIKGEAGDVLGYVGVFADLTERNAARRALEKTRDEAVQLADTKSRFLANMSHEIRTPLNGVLGVASLLKDTDLSPRQDDMVKTIRSAGTTLLRVLNDILDVSKIEAGKLSVEPTSTPLAEELNDTLALFRPGAEAKGLELHAEGIDMLPTVLMDGTRLRQIVGNLLSNAIKFTDTGSVTLSGTVDGDHLRLKVTDTGRGIPPEFQERVFESFVQTDAGRDMALGGTGLGLTLVQRMTELMGGRVRLQSSVGVGTSISLRFPLVRVGVLDDAGPSIQEANVAGLRVLLAEDNAVNAMVATAQLEALGCCATHVENGAEAVAEAARTRYDAILMDVHMPVMEGHAAARAIRDSGSDVLIVALTASALPDERIRCLESGMDMVLTKPFSRAEMATTLAQARI